MSDKHPSIPPGRINEIKRFKYFALYLYPTRDGRCTEVFVLRNNRSNMILGSISWYPRWRQFCFDTDSDTVWSVDCLADVQECLRIAKERWEKKRKEPGA